MGYRTDNRRYIVLNPQSIHFFPQCTLSTQMSITHHIELSTYFYELSLLRQTTVTDTCSLAIVLAGKTTHRRLRVSLFVSSLKGNGETVTIYTFNYSLLIIGLLQYYLVPVMKYVLVPFCHPHEFVFVHLRSECKKGVNHAHLLRLRNLC